MRTDTDTHTHRFLKLLWNHLVMRFIRSCYWPLLTGNVFVLIQWITVGHKPAWRQNLSPLDRYTTVKEMGERRKDKEMGLTFKLATLVILRKYQSFYLPLFFRSLNVNKVLSSRLDKWIPLSWLSVHRGQASAVCFLSVLFNLFVFIQTFASHRPTPSRTVFLEGNMSSVLTFSFFPLNIMLWLEVSIKQHTLLKGVTAHVAWLL